MARDVRAGPGLHGRPTMARGVARDPRTGAQSVRFPRNSMSVVRRRDVSLNCRRAVTDNQTYPAGHTDFTGTTARSTRVMTNPYAPPQAVVADVVDPRLTIVAAERGTRLAAAILDGLIMGGMIYAPFFIGAAIGGIPSGSGQAPFAMTA